VYKQDDFDKIPKNLCGHKSENNFVDQNNYIENTKCEQKSFLHQAIGLHNYCKINVLINQQNLFSSIYFLYVAF